MGRDEDPAGHGDRDIDRDVVWAQLRWTVEKGRRPDEPPQLIGDLTRPPFKAAYNHLERSQPDVEERLAAMLLWLHREAGDHGAVERAYAQAVAKARSWPKGVPAPVTGLQSQARGEGLLRVDHARKLAEAAGSPPPPDGWPSGMTKPEFDEEMARQKGHGRGSVA